MPVQRKEDPSNRKIFNQHPQGQVGEDSAIVVELSKNEEEI